MVVHCDTLCVAHHTDVTTLETESDMAKQVKAQATMTLFAFVKRAILALRDTNKSKGIHVVFSGFNGALRKQYGWDKAQAIEAMNTLAESGQIVLIPRKFGPMIYLPADAPTGSSAASQEKQAQTTLDKILG